MEEKSYVGMGFTMCLYCGKENEADCLLIDSRMRPTLGEETLWEWNFVMNTRSWLKKSSLCAYLLWMKWMRELHCMAPVH